MLLKENIIILDAYIYIYILFHANKFYGKCGMLMLLSQPTKSYLCFSLKRKKATCEGLFNFIVFRRIC